MNVRVRQHSKRGWRIMRWSLRILALTLLGCVAIGGYFWLTTPLPTADTLRERAALGNTRILDRHGVALHTIPDPLGGYQRPVAFATIPAYLRQATIALEDRSFYVNSGLDLRGIGRALVANVREGTIVGGGSTITQQLARNFLLGPEAAQQQTPQRKLRESVLALKLTSAYSKDDILSLYLNQTYYGGMTYGVEAAAWQFFGKPVRELDLAECALLAGLPQAPSAYNPLTHPEAALGRQRAVLDSMLAMGMITADQAAAASAEPLRFASGPAPGSAPHFAAYVLDQLVPLLGQERVLRGGLTITTTLDSDLQLAAERMLRQQISALSTPSAGQPIHDVRNGAIVALDPQTGEILAMVGSPDFSASANQGQVNAAIAHRQPGSAIKPLTYAAALERGWTPATTILDIPSAFASADGPPYSPENYDHAYHGPLALREALATSSNIAAVRTLKEIGVPALLEMAQRLGITTLSAASGRYGLALTLGGGEVTLLELTGAYATFASGGYRHPPVALLAATDSSGQPVTLAGLALAPADPSAQPVLAPEIAYLISDMLADGYARSRAFGGASPLDLDRPAAVKTGTTTDWRDNWTIGYTPDRVVGVWVGNADGQPMEAVSGVTGAGPLWNAVMRAAHRGLPARPFVRPPGIVEQAICAQGGMLPAPACPATRLERFVAGTQPTQADASHVALTIDPQRNCLLADDAHGGARRTFWLLPPEAEPWAAEQGLARPPTAPCGELPSNLASPPPPSLASQIPQLRFPAAGSVFAMSASIPADRQNISIQAQAGGDTQRLTIYLDDAPLGVLTAAPYQLFWQLAPGVHHIRLTALDGQGQVWHSAETSITVIND